MKPECNTLPVGAAENGTHIHGFTPGGDYGCENEIQATLITSPSAVQLRPQQSISNQLIVWASQNGYSVNHEGEVEYAGGKRKLWKNEKGYFTFGLKIPGTRRTRHIGVHRLMAYQKYGDAIFRPGIQVRHKDSNSCNNRPDNILIGTASENSMDRPKETRLRVSKTAGAKAWKHDHVKIREAYTRLKSYKKVMAELGIASKGVINYAVRKSKLIMLAAPSISSAPMIGFANVGLPPSIGLGHDAGRRDMAGETATFAGSCTTALEAQK